ncbi:MAG TPA: CoA pyrophosphatase [Bacteroides sp.]|nr:CoA pyrophosphatase [Bacteroides sp.]
MINKQWWKDILSSPLPGEKAQQRMAPQFREAFIHEADPAGAAVMILMYPASGKLFLALIKRNEYPGHHSAQVSFPGGMREAADRSLEETARRETCEELGIPDTMEILGSLTTLYIPVSNFLVTPFVGWLDHRPRFQPDISEVQYIIEVSVETLKDPGNCRTEKMFRHGQQMVTPCYMAGNERIWGATAMILSEYLELVSKMP